MEIYLTFVCVDCQGSGGMLSGYPWGLYGTSSYAPMFLWIRLTAKVLLILQNCSGAGICLYVDHLLDESSEEVRKLRGYMYSYKAM